MKKFSEIANKSKIPWVRLWIDDMWDFCENFIDRETGKIDYEAIVSFRGAPPPFSGLPPYALPLFRGYIVPRS